MSVALAIAAVLSAGGGQFAKPQVADGVQLVREACIETNLQRAAFERLGRERRWRAQRMTPRSSEPGWIVAFRTDSGLVMLIGGSPRDGDPSGLGASCSVAFDQVSPGLEGEVAVLAASLGLEGEGALADSSPGFVPVRVWSRLGGQTLTYAAATDGRAVISFSRQIVVSETTSPSPPGN